MRFNRKNNGIDYSNLDEKTLRKSLLAKNDIEQAMLEIADRFRSPDRFDSAVKFALEALVKFSGANRSYVMQLKSKGVLGVTHEATSTFTLPAKRFMQHIEYFEDPWIRDHNIQYGYCAIANIDEMPPEASLSKQNFLKSGAKAVLSTGFASNYKFKGTIAVLHRKAIDGWSQEICMLLMFICSLIEQSLERKEAEQKLYAEKERAEQADKLKAAFISNLSHEIRTPLNSIVGFSQLIASNQLAPDKRTKIAEMLTKNTNQLLSVMDDLLDVAQIQADSIKLENQNVAIETIVAILDDKYREEIVNKGDIDFQISVEEILADQYLYVDKNRLLQILDYILKNAIKFTDQGSIKASFAKSKGKIFINISDTGLGIDEMYFESIFERFWQVDPSHTRRYGGNGLGLSIAKDLIVLMGGNIFVDSKLGHGSTFKLTLPATMLLTQPIEKKQKVLSPNDAKQILVADDYVSIHEYILQILEPEGFSCTFAKDGMETMKLAEEGHFDLILLDIQMPYFDGKEILKSIRGKGINTPVIANTAHSTIEEENKFKELGFNGFIAKPFNPDQLIAVVDRCLSN